MIKILEQGAWLNYTNRLSEEELISQAMFLSTRYDCSATICATKKDLKLTQAYYFIHRCPDMSKRGETTIPELVGLERSDGIKAVKALKDFGDDGKVKELLLECIRGLLQADTYLFDVFGFKTREEYQIQWQEDRPNYCRAYWKELPPIEEWGIHIGAYDHHRTENYYTKYKNYVILQKNETEAMISGTYNDSFHEMYGELTYDLSIRNINFFDVITCRAPHALCYELSHTASESFIGKPIDSFSKREIGKILGGAPGCFHVVDVVYDMVSAAMELKNAEQIDTSYAK